jgi:hypothetical protein
MVLRLNLAWVVILHCLIVPFLVKFILTQCIQSAMACVCRMDITLTHVRFLFFTRWNQNYTFNFIDAFVYLQ